MGNLLGSVSGHRSTILQVRINHTIPKHYQIYLALAYLTVDFPLQPSDRSLGLLQSAGGPAPNAIMESKTRANELLRRLNPYLCAYLDVPQTARDTQYFTPRKLRWYDNPDLGIYIAVNNVVYDITSESPGPHSGGRAK